MREGQQIYCELEGQRGVVKSGPRLRVSDFRVGLTPPHDAKAIPQHDVWFRNGARATLPVTELKTLPQHWLATASACAEKHKALITLLLGGAGLALAAAKLFLP